ncbi:hypothetical protein IJ818_02820 [bacterium]|nr:hypothetical protein [bacterium]
MFFEKYKSHYSLNFFAICGWINLIGFTTSVLWQFLMELFEKNQSSDAIITAIFSLNWFFVFYATVTFFVFMLENFYEIKITNTKFLNNVITDILRIIGTILALIPFIFLFTAFLFLKF